MHPCEQKYFEEKIAWCEETIEILQAEVRNWRQRYAALVELAAKGPILAPAPTLLCCADCPTLKKLKETV